MNLSRKHKKLLIHATLSLVLGCINYYLFLPRISLFSFLPFPAEKNYYISADWLRVFMTGYFSDICWCIALYLVALVLYKRKLIHNTGMIFILVLPFLAEIAQYFKIMPGTFDWFDLLAYGIVLIGFFCLNA